MGRRDFEIDETISPPAKARIQYSEGGVKKEKVAVYIPYSRTTTRYITLTYRDSQTGEERTSDVVSSREGVTIAVLASANPTLCKSYLENGISAALSIEAWQVTNTTTTYTIGPDGPRAERETVDEYVSEFMFAGSMGIQEYVIDDVPVVLSNNLIHASRTITEYQTNEAMGVTKTLTTRYLCWGLTQEGSQLAAALASQATAVGDITALIADMSAFVCDGTRIQNTLGRDYGVQLRPSEQDEARDRLIRGAGYPVLGFDPPEASSLFNVGVKPDGFNPPDGFIPIGRGDGGSGSFDLPSIDPPVDPSVGDTWIDANDDNPYAWDGNDWTPVSVDPPSTPDLGDTWNDPETGDFKEWDGSDWVPYEPAPIDWDSDGFTPFTPDPPDNPVEGDQWIESGTGESFIWDGADWVPFTPVPGGYPVEAAGAIYRNRVTGILYIWRGTTWIPYLDSDPSSPDPGFLFVQAATGIERNWTGTAWVATGLTWPTYSLTPPGSPSVGTVWIDRNDHTPKRWSGTTWAPFTPVRPPNAVPGDTWTDAATGIPYVWTGAEWIAYTTTPPPNPTTGQTYINPTTGIEYAWTGSAWVETGEVFGSTILSNVQPTAADSIRSTEIDLPFPNDDTVAVDIGPGGVVRRWLVPGGVREQAQSLAELENALRYGAAYGSNVVVEAWQLPTEPLKPFYVRAGGIETQFLADGASWQWDADQLVVSCDGILCGATGRVPSERVVPWVPAMVDLAGLPAVGAPTVTSGPVPANTIATPAGFNAARPRGIWALLPTNGTDVFEEYRDPAHLFRPFTPVVVDQAMVLITISEVETPYSLVPIDQGQEDVVVGTFITEYEGGSSVVVLPLTQISVVALAPVVEAVNGLVNLPLTTISVTALAPVVESPGSVVLPLTMIEVTALAPEVGVVGGVIELPLTTLAVTALAPTVGMYDVDAAAYIAAVEAADGQALEDGVRNAITIFVAGCKTDGTWSAIKSACILAGARTLAGALVPLVGTAPTNNNFASGDYNRKTGLAGNGSTKWLNTNRNNNADGQNSSHLAVWVTTAPTSGTGSDSNAFPCYIGTGSSAAGASVIGRLNGNSNDCFTRAMCSPAATPTNMALATGLVGTSRASSDNYIVRFSGSNLTIAEASQAPYNGNIGVFREAAGAGINVSYSNGRYAFYSIGNSITLASLDSRLATLMSSLSAAIP